MGSILARRRTAWVISTYPERLFITSLQIWESSYRCFDSNSSAGLSRHFQHTMVSTAGVSQSALGSVTHAVTFSLVRRALQFILFPSPDAQHVTMSTLLHAHGFPGVLGVLDCAHISLRAPPVHGHTHESHRVSFCDWANVWPVKKIRFRCLDKSDGTLQYSPQEVSAFFVKCWGLQFTQYWHGHISWSTAKGGRTACISSRRWQLGRPYIKRGTN